MNGSASRVEEKREPDLAHTPDVGVAESEGREAIIAAPDVDSRDQQATSNIEINKNKTKNAIPEVTQICKHENDNNKRLHNC
uniref:Uncharacterized protein n=1 Tax=Romanomermis culicivorax TaxID=13658 RepID=A0A915K2B6_ROMCU